MKDWEAWKDEALTMAIKWNWPISHLEEIPWDAMKTEYFDEGLTPAEAWDEELRD